MAKSVATMTTRIGSRVKKYGELVKAETDKAIREWYDKDVIPQFSAYVADWSDTSKPRFIVRKQAKGTGRSFSLLASGTVTQKLRWKMIDKEGREGGKKKILAKVFRQQGGASGKPMRFRPNYHAKTSSSGEYNLPGTVDADTGRRWYGPVKSAYMVTQGAIKPRNFTKRYFKDKGKEGFRKAAKRGSAKAHRRIGKVG